MIADFEKRTVKFKFSKLSAIKLVVEKVKPIERDKLRLMVAFLKRKYGLLADQPEVTPSTNLKRSSSTKELNEGKKISNKQ